jgi:hypothetical protein
MHTPGEVLREKDPNNPRAPGAEIPDVLIEVLQERGAVPFSANVQKLPTCAEPSTPYDPQPSATTVDAEAGYRRVVIGYESRRGRHAEAMTDTQPGYDIKSYDRPGGKLLRVIEVKGIVTPWRAVDEIVELSRRQFEVAYEHIPNTSAPEVYWVYVVEVTGGRTTVIPIQDVPRRAQRFQLHASTWRPLAENEEEVPDIDELMDSESGPNTERGAVMIRKVELPSGVGGQLHLHSMPGRHESLSQAVTWIRAAKIERIYSLAGLDEIAKKSPDYRKAIDARELDPKIFEIEDYGVPQSRDEFLALARAVADDLRANLHVLIHCAGGHGRTGVLTRAVLFALGCTIEDAESAARAAGTAPETEEQRHLVDWCAKQVK